jgi:hypothetical protein
VELDQLQDDVTDGQQGDALFVLGKAERFCGLVAGLHLQGHPGDEAERVLEELQSSL